MRIVLFACALCSMLLCSGCYHHFPHPGHHHRRHERRYDHHHHEEHHHQGGHHHRRDRWH